MSKPILYALSLFCASALLAFVVACATNPTAAPPALAPAAATLKTEATATIAPTHLPRQHSAAQIEGLDAAQDAPHFVDSFPNHAQTLTQLPARIGINFDTPLVADSQLTLEKDGKPLALKAREFDPRKIYMSAALDKKNNNAPNHDGLYRIKYRVCFTDDGCHDGYVGFRVDAAQLKNFVDLRDQKNVTINLKAVRYNPNQIIISPGTMVTWVNQDVFEHFVNSDPHPSHNAYLKLNSLDIPPQKTFSFIFDEPGEYAFHCSAHVPQNMYGTILVQDAVMQTQTTASPTILAPAEITATSTATMVSPPAPPTIEPTQILSTAVPTLAPTTAPARVDPATLPPEKFAAHFVSSQPAHTALLERAPQKILLDFNFTLARNSNLNVLKDGEKLALGALEFSDNRLQLSVNLPDAGAGTYHVLYRACWPDKSCHDGEFAFVVRAP